MLDLGGVIEWGEGWNRTTNSLEAGMYPPTELRQGTLCGIKHHFISLGVMCLYWWERGEEKDNLLSCKTKSFA